MRIRCEDHWHHLSPTAGLLIIEAFQEGDLTSTRTRTARCLKHAFTAERVQKFRRLYKGNNITFDGETLNVRTHPVEKHQPQENKLGRVSSR